MFRQERMDKLDFNKREHQGLAFLILGMQNRFGSELAHLISQHAGYPDYKNLEVDESIISFLKDIMEHFRIYNEFYTGWFFSGLEKREGTDRGVYPITFEQVKQIYGEDMPQNADFISLPLTEELARYIYYCLPRVPSEESPKKEITS